MLVMESRSGVDVGERGVAGGGGGELRGPWGWEAQVLQSLAHVC